MFPRWYEIDGDTKEYIEHRKRVDTVIRQSKVERTRIEHENAKIKKDKAYDPETVRRALGNQGNKIERGFDGELRYNQTMVNLEKKVHESERRHLAKIRKKELKLARKAHEEAVRLNEVLALNKEANSEKWNTEGNSAEQFRRLQEALGKGGGE